MNGSVKLSGVSKRFGEGHTAVHALCDVSFEIPGGAMAVGRSIHSSTSRQAVHVGALAGGSAAQLGVACESVGDGGGVGGVKDKRAAWRAVRQ